MLSSVDSMCLCIIANAILSNSMATNGYENLLTSLNQIISSLQSSLVILDMHRRSRLSSLYIHEKTNKQGV